MKGRGGKDQEIRLRAGRCEKERGEKPEDGERATDREKGAQANQDGGRRREAEE